LSIKGERLRDEDPSAEYLYRGLALRDFERVFTLAEHMKVCGAKIKNGILSIQIEREIPESMKPRVINIVEVE
jgi:molecular chaperone IbpA